MALILTLRRELIQSFLLKFPRNEGPHCIRWTFMFGRGLVRMLHMPIGRDASDASTYVASVLYDFEQGVYPGLNRIRCFFFYLGTEVP